MIVTILVFIAVLLVIVLAHEWGHFFTARKAGMRVEEFGFGLPPRLFSWKGKKTVYSVNALPIGGFVRIAGENGLETDVPVDEQMESKPWYAQALVLVAGVACNVLLGFLLFFGAYLAGVPMVTDGGTPTILSVSPGSPAEKAGLQIGDILLNVTDKGKIPEKIDTETLHTFLQTTQGDVVITYNHAGEVHTATLTPISSDGNGKIVGIVVEPVSISTFSIPKAAAYAHEQTRETLGLIYQTVKELLGKLFTHPSAEGVLGPVGLVKTIGTATKVGFAYILALAATLSLNLAIINILPFPALDGGRLLIVLLEALTRRKFSKKIVSIIHACGFIFLIGLMILLTIHDLKG